MEAPKSLADWASILGFIWAIGATVVAAWQAHQRKQETKVAVAFLLGLKAAFSPAQSNLLTQVNDQIARLEKR